MRWPTFLVDFVMLDYKTQFNKTLFVLAAGSQLWRNPDSLCLIHGEYLCGAALDAPKTSVAEVVVRCRCSNVAVVLGRFAKTATMLGSATVAVSASVKTAWVCLHVWIVVTISVFVVNEHMCVSVRDVRSLCVWIVRTLQKTARMDAYCAVAVVYSKGALYVVLEYVHNAKKNQRSSAYDAPNVSARTLFALLASSAVELAMSLSVRDATTSLNVVLCAMIIFVSLIIVLWIAVAATFVIVVLAVTA